MNHFLHLLTPLLNPFAYTFYRLRRRGPMAEPSAAAARLQVIGSTCRLVSLLPAPKPHADSPGFDHLDRLSLVCSLTDDARRSLLKPTKVNVGFTYTRIYNIQSSW